MILACDLIHLVTQSMKKFKNQTVDITNEAVNKKILKSFPENRNKLITSTNISF